MDFTAFIYVSPRTIKCWFDNWVFQNLKERLIEVLHKFGSKYDIIF
jgi:uncharacterized protein with von Willebrand factor type A (vWA) domain